MSAERKITIRVRDELLAKAQEATGTGIGDTVHKGLELLAANDAYERLLKLRGKVKFSVALGELRED